MSFYGSSSDLDSRLQHVQSAVFTIEFLPLVSHAEPLAFLPFLSLCLPDLLEFRLVTVSLSLGVNIQQSDFIYINIIQ